MYELSLAIGNSLDPEKVCSEFISVMMRQIQLNYIGIWILPEKHPVDECIYKLFHAFPASRATETELPLGHPALDLGDVDFFNSFALEDASYSQAIVEEHCQEGSCAIFRLGSLGYVRLIRDKGYFAVKELRQLRPVINKLFIALGGALAYHQLQKEQAFQNSLIHTIPDLIWLKSPEGEYLSCNRRFEEFFGAKEHQIIGKTDYDFVDKELADYFRENDNKALFADSPRTNMEWVTFANDGKRALLETIKTPMKTSSGELVGVLGIGHDITALHDAQQQLKLAASVFEHASEGIMITDEKGRIIDVNKAFSQLTGYSAEEVIGERPSMLKSGHHSEEFFAAMWQSLKKDGHWRGEVWNRNKSGEIYAELLNIATVYDDDGNASHYVSIFSDITQLKEHQHELEKMAHFDALTQLPNRVLLSDRLQTALKSCKQNQQIMAVAYLDLDEFKPINDNHGHDVGDLLLIEVAKRLSDALGPENEIARLGGDEFVLLFTELISVKQCTEILEHLIDELSAPFQIKQLTLTISASIGVTLFPEDDADADTLIRHADQAMYTAKQTGRNRYHFFDPAVDRQTQDQHKAQDEIRSALDNREFVLFYQPKVNMRTGCVYGVEALIRWQHPTLNLLPPDSFLPQITDPGLSTALGAWVMEEAVSQLRIWRSAGLDLSMSINISAQHLQSPKFPEQLASLLQEYSEVPHDTIELEVLETAAFEDIGVASTIIDQCHDLGVRFALDDFGTGYSSLTYLRKIPADTVKIDRSFVMDMLEDEEDKTIVEGIIGLGKAFNREVIAEGVESAAHGRCLLQLGCDNAQGYGIAKPMPADMIPDWVATFRINEHWK
ncbi:EAL domain-containing protein [Neptuniibacter sp.]|uniref:putative bifunctional diguanylate cyclase/phosphodiesterase n=1 Tax=Neptuniibacter sp. TaxID=1962643 RepID=UPI0026144099|nr:EAL domain-containing protein [Neptuniibacter sp.]MCP4598349.1 EAL domain-containing protein [Neptuniibacter sp.]